MCFNQICLHSLTYNFFPIPLLLLQNVTCSLFPIHPVYLVPLCAQVWDHLLERRARSLKRPDSPPHLQPLTANSTQLGMGFHEPISDLCWDVGWLPLVQVLCMQS